jgi:hypothetical protein
MASPRLAVAEMQDTMRNRTRGIIGVGFLGAVLCGSSCYAASAGWNGAGWYQIETDAYMGAAATGGPFGTKSDCDATLGRSDEEATEVCTYFATEADYDKI